MKATFWGARGAAVVVVSVAIVLGTATAAEAADEVEVTWAGGSTSAAGSIPLFDGASTMVPGGTQSGQFLVANLGSRDGYLRVTIIDVVTTDPAFATALTVAAGTPDVAGQAFPLSEATPCRVLIEGDIVEAGDSIAVLATLALGDLDGTSGQSGSASFSLRVSLSDTATAGLPPTDCGTGAPGSAPPATVVVPAAQEPTGRTGRAAAATPGAPAVPDATADEPFAPESRPAGGLAFAQNTGRMFEEYTLFFLIVPWLFGIGVYLLRAWRRRHLHDEGQS